MNKENLFGKTLSELQGVVNELNMPTFTAKQIASWLYQKAALSIDDMTNISLKNRELIKEKFTVDLLSPQKVQVSKDGTKKYLFTTKNGHFIETAMIPDKDRKTICLSSQVGCKMACNFCMTARQGFQNQLTADEILNQFRNIDEFEEISNFVYMGMGEPFDNIEEVLKSIDVLTSPDGYAFSPKRITVSSVGVLPGMRRFLEETKCHLAISLHSPFAEERKQLMPVERAYPLAEVLKEIKSFDFGLQRRVSFEYIVFKNLNDTPKHIKEMARLLGGLKCRVNLIRFHQIPDSPLLSTDEQRLFQFKDDLNKKGIFTTIRSSRGEDIFAACGLLSTKELESKKTKQRVDSVAQ